MLPEASAACTPCLRRSILLAELSTRIDHAAPDLDRVVSLLRLDDAELIRSVAGKRKHAVTELSRAFDASRLRLPAGITTVCRHSHGFGSLPHALFVTGSDEPLRDPPSQRPASSRVHSPIADPESPNSGRPNSGSAQSASRTGAREVHTCPRVGIIGCERPSDYGRHVAHQLAAELAASGLTVVSTLAEGIGVSALAGALRVEGTPLALSYSGLAATPSHLQGLRRRLSRHACLASLLPPDSRRRRWSRRAALATLAQLSSLVVIIEDHCDGYEHQLARHARQAGVAVGAIPGRIGARCSAAPHALIRDGVPLIRGAEDALDLIYGADQMLTASDPADGLPPQLASTLDRVAAGQDTLQRLLETDDPARTLIAVGELEALRLVVRAPGGRYLARVRSRPATASSVTG